MPLSFATISRVRGFNYSAQPKGRVPSLKSGSFFFGGGVANWHSWDADWSQVGNLETLMGSRAVFWSHALALAKSLFSELYKIMVLACQVGPFHLMLTQINSEINCIAKNKCPDSQKLDARRRGENLNTKSHVSRATTWLFLHSLSLIYSMWGKKSVKKSHFHSETKSYSVEYLCYYWNATDRWFDHTKTW